MSSKISGIRKNKLARRLAEEGFEMVVPCTRCAQLNKSCVKCVDSSRCGECARSNQKCVDSPTTFSDKEWRRLVAAQEQIRVQKKEMFAKLQRLEMQDELLRKRAGDFITRDIKEIEELERLEKEEEEERKREAERQKSNEMIAAAIQEFPVLPNGEFDHVLSDFLSGETLESFQGNSSA
jgi:hypothetical protein